eukprot:PITA_12344
MLEYDLEIKPTKLIKGQGMARLMVESNLNALDINLIVAMSEDEEESSLIHVSEMFLQSPWYLDIVYVLQHLSPPPGMIKNKGRSLKHKAAKFYILNNSLYWKDPGGVLLNCLIEDEAQQQWGLDFIREIHPTSSAYHKWILIETNYFTKWIKAILARQATYMVIIQFLESKNLSCFGCPNKIITDNEATFKSKKMINFCSKYKITLGHSTTYYLQENGMAESSNKSLVNIIKKMLEKNKKGWHKKLVNALWADRVSQKKSIGMSPFELVCGIDTVFPTSLAVPVVKILQEAGSEEDDFQRRINQMIHLHQTREEVFQNTFRLQEKIKKVYDRKTKADKFQLEDVVLRWDARNEDKGKHGKFENLWKGPYKIVPYRGQNAFLLKEMDGQDFSGGPVNGRLLKHCFF